MRPESRMRVAAMAVALGMTVEQLCGIGGTRIIAKRTRPHGWSTPHQGKQEMARRVRQIERWQLTVSNGLMPGQAEAGRRAA